MIYYGMILLPGDIMIYYGMVLFPGGITIYYGMVLFPGVKPTHEYIMRMTHKPTSIGHPVNFGIIMNIEGPCYCDS